MIHLCGFFVVVVLLPVIIVTVIDSVAAVLSCAVSCIQGNYMEKRDVRQFQFTAWPDHGVPEHPLPLLQFIRRVKSMTPTDSLPTVVHCR